MERSVTDSVDWILGALSTVMKVDGTITTTAIVDAIALHHGYTIKL